MNNIAYLKGVLADGHVYDGKGTIRIVVRQKDDVWLRRFIAPVIKQITNKEPKIIQTSDGIYMLWIYVRKNEIPKETLEILLQPLNEVKFENGDSSISFVRGFFEAEGQLYISKNKKQDFRVIMHQKDSKVLENVKEVLDKLEIKSKIYGPYKNDKSYIFRLIIFTKRNVEKFWKTIEPSNSIKFNKKVNFLSA
ncbi:MAG: LAGLIDADG family homing endonuclease [Candidatus Aenigmarchaeota archaeon]|nr:LAGLIDADG family homing endonuclease [Candidatus Aenigmarchaeota archaeon]